MEHVADSLTEKKPWNKGKLVGQKPRLILKEIWAIRIRLQIANRLRDLALFNLAIDSKLRACDLVKLCVRDLSHGDRIAKRTMVMQQKTQQTAQIEIMQQTREAILDWVNHAKLKQDDYLFPSRIKSSPHLSTRQYARIVESWVASNDLDPAAYGTHSLRPIAAGTCKIGKHCSLLRY